MVVVIPCKVVSEHLHLEKMFQEVLWVDTHAGKSSLFVIVF